MKFMFFVVSEPQFVFSIISYSHPFTDVAVSGICSTEGVEDGIKEGEVECKYVLHKLVISELSN